VQCESDQAALFIDGQRVGVVRATGADGAWGWGDFVPEPPFSRFAAFFGRWSLLMHADEAEPTITDAAAQELRDAEIAIDALHAELHWMRDGKVTPISQINIDGPQIEWKSHE
jgi:hypothetical protein